MKTLIFTFAAGLICAASSTAVFAQGLQLEATQTSAVIYNQEAPSILNDLVCVKSCDQNHLSCDPANAEKTSGRCS